MTVRISELNELSVDLVQSDVLPVVDISAGETKKIQVGNLLAIGISGAPSSFIDLAKLNQSSATKLSYVALASIGVASGTYGSASTVPQFTVNNQGLVSYASGVAIVIPASSVTGLAPVATSGTYASLSGLPTLGTLSSQNANSVVISGGTISGVTFISGNVTISGGTISGITDIAIGDGGTGASTASGARVNLGLAIGTDVQAYSPVLSGVAEQFDNADEIIYSAGSGIVASTPFTSLARSIVSGSTASAVRSTIGLGTIATQDASSVVISGGTISGITFISGNVTISGGTISGITDLAIADGGTGASTASGARTNLGLAIGSDVQAYSSVLSGVAAQFTAANEIIYASASGVVSSTPFTALARSIVSGSTASGVRSTLGLGTIATQDANSVAISGGTINGVTFISGNVTISGGTISGITDLAIADGGTGASTASGARTNLGLVIGTDVQAYNSALASLTTATTASGQIIYTTASGQFTNASISSLGLSLVGQNTASGVRNAIGLGDMALQNAGSVVISGGTISGITDIAIEDGGTGASTASGARANLGLVIGTDVQAYDPALLSIANLSTSADQLIYTTAADTYATSPITPFGRSLLASGSSAPDARIVLGLGSLSTLSVVTSGYLDNSVVTSGTIADGNITSSKYAAESIGASALASNAVTTAKINDNAVTAAKLADNSSIIVTLGSPAGSGDFIGQKWVDTATKIEYVWDGSAWERQSAINEITFTDATPIAFSVAYPNNYSATITTTLDSQNSNTVFAGPTSGGAATPSFRALEADDLPIATSSGVGAVLPGTGLQVSATGTLNHSNSASAGTYAGPITIDAQGHIVSAQTSLQASDIPNLDASKITTGTFSSEFLAPNSVTASQLADYGIAQVSESAPVPEFAGQWWINPNDRSAYIWVGEVTPVPNGYWLNLGYGSPTQINLRFGGTYNASGNIVESINSYGIEAGLTVGQALASPNTSNNGVYLICTSSGVGTAPAPTEALTIGNWVLSQGVGATWTKVALSSAVAGVGDQDVLVDGSALVPVASGVASQEDLNEILWGRAQIATGSTAGIVRASSEIVVASGTGIMTIGITDDGLY